jgi:hypothetical protein
MLSRREFGKRGFWTVVAAFVLPAGIASEIGCTPTSWEAGAQAILQLLGPAVDAALNIITAGSGANLSWLVQLAQTAIGQATSAIGSIGSLITQFEQADAANQGGILTQIQTAIGVVKQNLNMVLTSLHVLNPATVQKVTNVVDDVIDELDAIADILPAIKAGAPLTAAKLSATRTKKGAKLDGKSFARRVNAHLRQKSGIAAVDAAAEHSLLPE